MQKLEIQQALEEVIIGEQYARAYRAFVYALGEAHASLSLGDINDLTKSADVQFAQNHVCTCGKCGDPASVPAH